MDPDLRSIVGRVGAFTDAYRTRLLAAIAGSLLVVLGLLHSPVYTDMPAFGWRYGADQDLIHLSEVTDPSADAGGDEAAQAGGGTIPTRQKAAADPTLDPSPQADPQPTGTSADAAASNSSSEILPIAALGPGDDRPRIVGGMGALYLQIHYPREARLAGVQGRLRLSFVVDPEGNPRSIEVAEPLHPACDSAAVRALRKVRFRPGSQNGSVVPVRMTLPVRFRLLNANADTPGTDTESDNRP